MEYRNPPHTDPFAGQFVLNPQGLDYWGVEFHPFNKIQKRPVIKDCIDVGAGQAFIYNSYQSLSHENVAFVPDSGVDYEATANGVPTQPLGSFTDWQTEGTYELSRVNTVFKYWRPFLPFGAEDFFSDCVIQISGKLVTNQIVLRRNNPNEGFTNSGWQEVSRQDVGATVNFSGATYEENQMNAPDLDFVREKSVVETDIFSGYTYIKKITYTLKSVWPNDDEVPSPDGYDAVLLQFDVTGLRTFYQ